LVVDPAVINAAAVGRSDRLSGAEAVEDLDLVQAVQVDAGVGSLRQHEFQIQLGVAELFVSDEIDRASLAAVENAIARTSHGCEARGAEQRIPKNAGSGEPFVAGIVHAMPAGEIFAVEQRLPAVLQEER